MSKSSCNVTSTQGKSFTLCPLCNIDLTVKSLKRHLERTHSEINSVECPVCINPVSKRNYPFHLCKHHKREFLFDFPIALEQRSNAKARCYKKVAGKDDVYICKTCNVEISERNILRHQAKVHQLDFMSPKVVMTMKSVSEQKKDISEKKTTPTDSNQDSKQPSNISNIKKSLVHTRALNNLLISDRVPLRVSQILIINSAFWYTHPCGRPAGAPKHHKRIQFNNRYGAIITFGANTFLIESAAKKLIQLITSSLDEDDRLIIDKATLIQKQYRILESSVSGYNGMFSSYRIKDDGHMQFGAQSIHAPSFIKTITDQFCIKNG